VIEAMDIRELQARARRNEPLAKHTTARIGGPADLLIEVQSVEELVAVAQRADEMGLPYLVLGGGQTSWSATPACAAWSSSTAPRR